MVQNRFHTTLRANRCILALRPQDQYAAASTSQGKRNQRTHIGALLRRLLHDNGRGWTHDERLGPPKHFVFSNAFPTVTTLIHHQDQIYSCGWAV